MIILWFLSLAVIIAAELAVLIMRGKPRCLRGNMHGLASLLIFSCSVVALNDFNFDPPLYVIGIGVSAAIHACLRATREALRQNKEKKVPS